MRLDFIKETGIEVKTAAVFAAAALVISVLTGFLSGIGAGTVIIRSLFALVIFACLGFGSAWVLKKFVPELGAGFPDDSDGEDEDLENDHEVFGAEEDSGPEQAEVPETDSGRREGEFSEFSGSDFPSVSSSGTGDSAEEAPSSPNVSMGKHIVSDDDNSFGYDPETMARAVRTMIKKDE